MAKITFDPSEVSLCENCLSMTHTVDRNGKDREGKKFCGKCGIEKLGRCVSMSQARRLKILKETKNEK